jgi:hypothetical protein
MASGTPGDHPYTDIVYYARDTYSTHAANLVREIAAMADEPTRRTLADLLLRDFNPHLAPDVARLELWLTELRNQVRREAIERGHEVPEPQLNPQRDPG